MGYNPKPKNTTRYNTQAEAQAAGETYAKQGVDKGWYGVTALNGYAGQNLNYGGIIDMATPAMQKQWEEEDLQSARQAATDQLNVANATRDREYQAMLEIQQQTVAATQAQENERSRLANEKMQQEAEAARQATAAKEQAALTSANQRTDLTSENNVNIVAAASAQQADSANTAIKKKQGVGIASRVGINV